MEDINKYGIPGEGMPPEGTGPQQMGPSPPPEGIDTNVYAPVADREYSNFLRMQQEQSIQDLYDAFYALLTQYEKVTAPDGTIKWVRFEGSTPLVNDEGAQELINIYKSLVNLNRLNSNYTEKRIRALLRTAGKQIALAFHANYRKWVPKERQATHQYKYILDTIMNFVLNTTLDTLLRALNGEERKSSREKGVVSIYEERRPEQPRRRFPIPLPFIGKQSNF